MRVFAKLASGLILLTAVVGAAPAGAQESQPALVTDIRVYDPGIGAVVFITLSNTTICGTNIFQFNLNSVSGQGMLSQSIAALAARRSVVVELASTGCVGAGSMLKSITLTTRPVS